MTHTAISANKTVTGFAAAAVAAAALVASSLGSAPAAHATCASFWGIGNGGGCTSTFGAVAIAIGPGAEAVARGIGATAVSIGNGAETAVNGAFSYGSSVGNGLVFVGNINGTDFGNIAMSFGDDSETQAGNPGGGGVFNMATNFGNGNSVFAFGSFNNAFAIFSSNTDVTAMPGPLATAGSIGQNGVNITKQGPGININGVRIGGAAAPTKAAANAKSASAVHPATTGKAGSVTGLKKKAGSASAAKHTSTK
jgi:hypothetical protein